MQPTSEGETSRTGLSPIAIRLLAGLDTGVVAGLPALAWLLFHSWLRGEQWWAKLNVAGALFFGESVYSMGLSRASLAGGALLVVGYGLLGAVFGLIARPRGIARNLILGFLLAIAWQLACQKYLLRLVNPFAPAYFPPLSTLPAQLMFGLGLARFSGRFQSLAADWGDSSWAPAWVQIQEPAPVSPVAAAGPPDFDAPFTGPMPADSFPDSPENAVSGRFRAEDGKRGQETDC
ncbi:MAG TPA: hypothetical protein VGK29_11310 [Paludibaculum sp.]|jgi:hypothetical protein